jgi:hypothetical protein
MPAGKSLTGADKRTVNITSVTDGFQPATNGESSVRNITFQGAMNWTLQPFPPGGVTVKFDSCFMDNPDLQGRGAGTDKVFFENCELSGLVKLKGLQALVQSCNDASAGAGNLIAEDGIASLNLNSKGLGTEVEVFGSIFNEVGMEATQSTETIRLALKSTTVRLGASIFGTSGTSIFAYDSASKPLGTVNLVGPNTQIELLSKAEDIEYDSSGSTLSAEDVQSAIDELDTKIPSSSGEVNTASNLGAGEGVFAQKTAEDLEFKSLVAGAGIALSSDANEITISSTASAEATIESRLLGETPDVGSPQVFRMADPALSDTAGRLYLAANDASVNEVFYVIGVGTYTGGGVGSSQEIVKSGTYTFVGHGLPVGRPVYLNGSGGLTATAPSAPDEAVVKVGIVKDADTIDIQIQVIGIN